MLISRLGFTVKLENIISLLFINVVLQHSQTNIITLETSILISVLQCNNNDSILFSQHFFFSNIAVWKK